MAAPIPSAYSRTSEHLLDDLPSIFVGDKGRIPIHPLPLQQVLHGLRDEFVLVHGPGGVGKSDLGINIALGASAEVRVIIMSLELSSKAIMRRMLPLVSALSDFDSRIDAQEFVEMDELPLVRQSYKAQIVSQSKRVCSSITIVDDSFTPGEKTGRTVEELRNAIHQFRSKGEDLLVVVDYVQLLSLEGSAFTATDQIDRISRILASIAHTEQVPVIAISAVGKDGSIRGSSMLQHDADIVLKMTELEDCGDERTVRLLFEKWREGVSGTAVDLSYVPASHLFC